MKEPTMCRKKHEILGALFLFFFCLQGGPGSLEALAGGDPESPPPAPDNAQQTLNEPSGGRPDLESMLRQMDAVYGNLQSFQAEFHQVSEAKTIQRTRQSSGNVYFLKPDKMRWSYRVPEKQEIYLMGEQIYVYLPQKNLVINQTLDQALPGMAPARLFMGVKELSESFTISLASDARQENKAHCLRLVPKQRRGISVEEILLWVAKEGFLPVKTESWDLLGNHTTLTFRNGKANKNLSEKIFRFQIPSDAEVVSNFY